MKKIISIVCTMLLAASTAIAQPSAVQKAGKSVFTLTTFKADNSILASTHGVFTGTDGEAVSSWTPFVGAARAVVIDADGQQHNVEAIYGTNELYDVCRFRVDGKTQSASLAKSNANVGNKLWLVGYSVKKPQCKTFTVKNAETFGEQSYGYYIFNEQAAENMADCPFVNQNGEIVGLLQHSKNNNETHATDARFINAFRTRGLSINDPVMRQTSIRVALPEDINDARLMLMIAGEKNDSTSYAGYIADFIRMFPTAIDGYSARAQRALATADYPTADATMQAAIINVTSKDEAHSAYSSIIYQKEAYMQDSTYPSWTLQKAFDEANAAYNIKPEPVYQHQMAQVNYAMGNYQQAYQQFIELTKSNIRNGELFYEAAQCHTQLGGTTDEVLALLDSAVNVNPENSITAPYYLARGRMLDQAGEYRKAVADYNKYDTLMLGRGSHEFYYIKFKAESRIRQYQQALNDIAHAIILNRREPTYYAEMASLQLRVNQLEEAIHTADLCIALEPEYADPYIVKGIAQGELKQKNEALETLTKAKELGDKRAQELIEKYK
ncbi:MAG: tetratricopeptide repeat protein [Prevotella sp.]|nr:tetratricopeptide repeat protein [Prevotella sp.]